MKTRGISIKRWVKCIEVEPKTQKEVEVKRNKRFICRINAAIPFSHRMFQSE